MRGGKQHISALSKRKKEKRPRLFVFFSAWKKYCPHFRLFALLGGGLIVVVLTMMAIGINVWAKSYQNFSYFPQSWIDNIPLSAKSKKTPTVLPRHLDGMIVAADDSNLLPACVMIENAAFGGVRPQSGLSRALVVYEVIVEGGITRLMAVFGGETTSRIGPVRSARDTFLEFASEYNCMYSHAGGSFTAIKAIDNFNIRNNDALWEPNFFWREPRSYAPHNLFTSSELLEKALFHWKKEDPPSYTSWNFVDTMEQRAMDTIGHEVTIHFGGSYDATYRYQADKHYYERWNGSVLQTDAVNGEVLSARNVVIQKVGEGIYLPEKGRVNWPVTGEGEVIVYRDGVRTDGRWQKADRTSRTMFVDNDGNPMMFVRGNTWIDIVPPHIDITFDEK